jgi:hypothetical protein
MQLLLVVLEQLQNRACGGTVCQVLTLALEISGAYHLGS